MTRWIETEDGDLVNEAHVRRARRGVIQQHGQKRIGYWLDDSKGGVLGFHTGAHFETDKTALIPAPPGWHIVDIWFEGVEVPIISVQPLIAFAVAGVGTYARHTLIGLTESEHDIGARQGGEFFTYARDPQGRTWVGAFEAGIEAARSDDELIAFCRKQREEIAERNAAAIRYREARQAGLMQAAKAKAGEPT